eukprot:gene18702-20590_t
MKKAPIGYEVDDILPFVGEFSRFQYILELLLCIAIIPQTLQVLIMYFAAQNPGWRCVANSTVCKFHNITYTSSTSGYESRCNMPRGDWEFVQPKDYSIVTEFDLHCDTEIYAYFTTSFFFVGWGVGAVVLGLCADWFGRWKVLFPSLGCVMVVGFVSVFSPNFWVFLTTRIIVGFFTPGTGVLMFVMASEFVGNKYRPMAGIILWLFFTIALVIVGVKAYFIRKWKILFMICTAPYIFTLAFAKFVPESIRWLNLNGRTEEAMAILRRIAKFNKMTIPDHVTLKPHVQTEKHKTSPLDLFRPTRTALTTLFQAFAWMVNGLVYYGVALAADDLGGDMYRNYIVASLVEFPAVILAIYFCDKIGRKKTVVPAMFLASATCIAVAFIPTDKGSALAIFRIVCGMSGKMFVAISFDAIYTWSVEIYPTVVRSQGMGLLQITSRLGAAGAPWVAKYLKVYSEILPFTVMGGITLLSTFTLLYLPETKGVSTAETLEEKPHEITTPVKGEEAETAGNVNLGYLNATCESTAL